MNTEEVKKVLKWAYVTLIVLAIFLISETLVAFKNLQSIDPVFNSISVTGEGEIISIPDVATFSFTVSDGKKVVSDAQAYVTEKVDDVLASLKTLGVEEKDIKTIEYSISPKVTYEPSICSPTYCPPSRRVEDGYTVSHSISVKIRNTKNAGKALALVGEKGATNLSNISFTIDDPEKVLDEARAKAIADAKDKAKLLAKELDVRLVRVVSFYDNSGGPVPYYAVGIGGDEVMSKSVAPTIPVGENKTIVNITVVYEIK